MNALAQADPKVVERLLASPLARQAEADLAREAFEARKRDRRDVDRLKADLDTRAAKGAAAVAAALAEATQKREAYFAAEATARDAEARRLADVRSLEHRINVLEARLRETAPEAIDKALDDLAGMESALRLVKPRYDTHTNWLTRAVTVEPGDRPRAAAAMAACFEARRELEALKLAALDDAALDTAIATILEPVRGEYGYFIEGGNAR